MSKPKRRVHPESRRAHARALRREGKSYSVISDELGIPVGTVAEWLRGEGEPAMVKECWCGQRFIARRRDQFSCSTAHATKHYALYGPTVRGPVKGLAT